MDLEFETYTSPGDRGKYVLKFENCATFRITYYSCSLGTISEWEYTELAVIVFFWDLFWFQNERDSIPSILLPIAELME